MRNKISLDERKDGLLFHRAQQAVDYSTILLNDELEHIRVGGKALCGSSAKRLRVTPLQVVETCGECAQALRGMVVEQMKVEARNYWLNPEHGGGPLPNSLKKQRPTNVKYEKVPLPNEFLPTGSGMLVRDTHG